MRTLIKPKSADDIVWRILINEANTNRYKHLLPEVEGCHVLEVGCHYGYFACLLAEKNAVTAIDLDPEFLRIAGDVVKANGIKTRPFTIGNIQLVKVNAKKLPFKDKQFDVGFLCELLEHLSDPLPVLRESARVVKNRLYITTPAKGVMPPERVSAHRQDFSLNDVVELAKQAGLIVTKSFADNVFNYVFTEKGGA